MKRTRRSHLFRRGVLLFTQIILISVFGCGPVATPIIIDLPTSTRPPGEPTQPPATPFLPTAIPSITPTTFVPIATIKIFSHVPLTGDQAEFGNDILRGTELAVEQLSDPLHERQIQVELVSFDDQGDVSVARSNAQSIVTDSEILCGVGHYGSDTTLAASDVYHQGGLPFVAPSTTAPLLTDLNYLEANRVIARADGQGTVAAQFAQAQQYASTYIITQQAQTSLRNAEAFRAQSGGLGIQWLGTVVIDTTPDSLNTTVSKIASASPAVVYISSTPDRAIPYMLALRAAGYTGAFLGTEDLHNPSLINQAGPSLLDGGGLYYTISSPPPNYHPDTEQFIFDYTDQYGSPPLSFAARAYDAAGICLKGIDRAFETKGGGLPTRNEVARAIRRLNNYEGLTGEYDFNREGDPDPVPYYVYQVTTVDLANWDQNPIIAAYEVPPP